MLHLIKLAVGVADPAALRVRQAGRPLLRTRNFPRRSEEILEGGSVFWVMGGVLSCRQRVLEIGNGCRDDGTPCTTMVLDKPLVPVVPRLMRPFQGWRYLTAADAPEDLEALSAMGGDVLPPALRRALAALCLI